MSRIPPFGGRRESGIEADTGHYYRDSSDSARPPVASSSRTHAIGGALIGLSSLARTAAQPLKLITQKNADRELREATKNSSGNGVLAALQADANIDGTSRLHGHSPLEIAVGANDVPMIRTLLAAGANPNVENTNNSTTPLYRAVKIQSEEAVDVLLADVRTRNNIVKQRGITPLNLAANIVKKMQDGTAAHALAVRIFGKLQNLEAQE